MFGCTTRRSSAISLTALAFTFAGCSGVTDVPPEQREPARLAISANVASTTIATMVVTVTGPGITTPLVFNLTLANGSATGFITIPAGSSRLIELDAYDAKGIKTHRGVRTLDEVLPGSNPSISVVLLPMAGEQPVTASLGSVTISVTPNPGIVQLGQAPVQFTAEIRDKDGTIVVPPDGEVVWATTQPAFFSVSSSGLVTGILAGSGQVVATYNGFAGIATVTVSGP